VVDGKVLPDAWASKQDGQRGTDDGKPWVRRGGRQEIDEKKGLGNDGPKAKGVGSPGPKRGRFANTGGSRSLLKISLFGLHGTAPASRGEQSQENGEKKRA